MTALPGLARAAAAPLICGLALLGLLCGWVVSGGFGSVSHTQLSVSRASIPMPSFAAAGVSVRRAPAYLTVSNLASAPDTLVSASSPAASRVVVTGGPVTIPAASTVSLSPFGPDLVLVDPRSLVTGQRVLLRLRFRRAGRVLVEAEVTAPGAP